MNRAEQSQKRNEWRIVTMRFQQHYSAAQMKPLHALVRLKNVGGDPFTHLSPSYVMYKTSCVLHVVSRSHTTIRNNQAEEIAKKLYKRMFDVSASFTVYEELGKR